MLMTVYIGNVFNYPKCSQGNVMNAHRSLFSVVAVDQPKKDNNNKH
jgi:hypothetical protein